MAQGSTKPAFFLAVLLIVAGLVGLALWRFGALPGVKNSTTKEDTTKQASGIEAADSQGITTVKQYSYQPAQKLPPVQGISKYSPMADRTVRFAINVWAGWAPIIFANNGFKAGKAWKTPSGKDFKVELTLIVSGVRATGDGTSRTIASTRSRCTGAWTTATATTPPLLRTSRSRCLSSSCCCNLSGVET